jgi:hypothetical protein
MNNEFKYIPYDANDENIRDLIKNGNVYNMKRGLSGILLPKEDMDEAFRDYEYLKEMYPGETKKLSAMVEEECDKLEYEGSPMLVEYPDKEQIRKIARKVYNRLDDDGELGPGNWGLEYPPEEDRPSYNEPPYVPRRNGCANCALRNLIEILVCNEFFCRRERYRNRRRRFY